MTWPERSHTVPDGREVRATYQGEPVGWVVHVVGAEGRRVSGRAMHDILDDLLKPGPGQWPQWLMEATSELAGRDTPLGRRFACPCCGYLTLGEVPTDTYDICDVCFWEDDGVQFRDPQYEGGANNVSLQQARQNFRRYGVSEGRPRTHVRPPMPDEEP